MSDPMEGNPYINHMETVPTTNAEAQLDAALSLAFEQRTANLIAMFVHVDAQGDMPDHAADLIAQITERLGLK